MVSKKDAQKLELRREMFADVEKELEDYRRLMDRVIGSQEEGKV